MTEPVVYTYTDLMNGREVTAEVYPGQEVICPNCHGSGDDPDTMICCMCGGDGTLAYDEPETTR